MLWVLLSYSGSHHVRVAQSHPLTTYKFHRLGGKQYQMALTHTGVDQRASAMLKGGLDPEDKREDY